MPHIEVEDGVQIFTLDLGAGDPVVLIPGFGMTTVTWDATIRTLTSAGHRVIALDQRGHGQSDKPLSGYDLDRLADDVVAVLDARGVKTCVMVGWSFGGQVAFNVAVRATERVRGLVLVGSNAVRASRSEDFPFGLEPAQLVSSMVGLEVNDRLASRRSTIRSGFAQPPDEATLDWMTQQSLLLPSWAAVECYRTMFESDLIDSIDAARLPVLQIIGTEDPIHSAKAAHWLSERLSNSTLVELAECGHYPMVEAPEAFDRALLAFLA